MREITNCGATMLEVSFLSPLIYNMSYADEAYFATRSRIKELRRPSMEQTVAATLVSTK